MKKILSHGSIKVYRAKCNYCDCEFEYQYSDLEDYKSIYGTLLIGCPDCDRLLQHSESSVTTTRMTTESL